MKAQILILASVLAVGSTSASPTMAVGTPGNAYLSKPTGPSPSFAPSSDFFNFDSLTAFATFAPNTYSAEAVNISSPDGLVVYPYSTQSGPNELFDNSANGSANIKITTFGSEEIGIGIADSDVNAQGVPVTVDLQALNASGGGFGTVFAVTLPTDGSNPGNGYFTISDSKYDLYGLQITQPVGNAALYSGLAIDDLQVEPTPEPASLALMGAGLIALAGIRKARKSA